MSPLRQITVVTMTACSLHAAEIRYLEIPSAAMQRTVSAAVRLPESCSLRSAAPVPD